MKEQKIIYCISKIVQCPNKDCARYWTKAPYDVPSTYSSSFDYDPNTGKCKWYIPDEE